MNRAIEKLKQYKFPLLILAVGLILLTAPFGSGRTEAVGEEEKLREALSLAEGVGESEVLISEHGVLVVCEGGDSACVKLDILRAVGSYTGFGSDRITILKMLDR